MLDRVASAQQFVDHVNKHGGATMDIRTGRLVQPGERGYIVGGESDRTGARIPTSYVPEKQFDHTSVLNQWQQLEASTSGKGAALGAWRDSGNVELDASRVIKSPGKAVRRATARGEKAVWDNARMRPIDTTTARTTARLRADGQL